MKISFWIPHAKLSGGTRVTVTYANFLRKQGHDVEVVVESPIWYRRMAANIFKVLPTWISGRYNITLRRTDSFLNPENIKADVVVADSHQVAAKLIQHNAPIKMLEFVQHDERMYHGDPQKVSAVYSMPIAKVAVSTWLKEMLSRDFNQESQLILNSFDREIFHPVSKVKSSDVRILILDHSYAWKGTAEAIEAVRKVQQKYPQVKLIGFGARRAESGRLYDEYHFDPPQKLLAELYSSCDIFCCSSWDEGFGLPSLEAMACGVAVVTYDNGGSADFARHEQNALVVPRKNTVALTEALLRVVGDIGLRTRLQNGAKMTAEQWPTWQEQACKLERVILDL